MLRSRFLRAYDRRVVRTPRWWLGQSRRVVRGDDSSVVRLGCCERGWRGVVLLARGLFGGRATRAGLAAAAVVVVALPSASAAPAPPTHVLQVRWTAAAFSYAAGKAVPHEGNGQSSFAWHAGFDIVWQDTIAGTPGNWGPSAFGLGRVLYASAEITNTSDSPGVSCSGTFTPFDVSRIQASLSGLVWELPNPVATSGWTPSSPAGTICFGFPDWSGISTPSSKPTTSFTPQSLPVPPYPASATTDYVRSIDAPIYVDPKTLTAEQSYTYQSTGSVGAPDPITAHTVWSGCVRVQIDPPTPRRQPTRSRSAATRRGRASRTRPRPLPTRARAASLPRRARLHLRRQVTIPRSRSGIRHSSRSSTS